MIKQIINYEGLYEINESGEIFSTPRKGTKGGLMPHIKGQYPMITLTKKRVLKRFRIHRLVAIHFIPNPNDYLQINHKDGNKYNCHVTNLEWCTNSMNMIHAYATGLKKKMFGVDNPNGKLTNEQVKEIAMVASSCKNYGRKKLAERFNISESTVKDIVSNRRNRLTNVY